VPGPKRDKWGRLIAFRFLKIFIIKPLDEFHDLLISIADSDEQTVLPLKPLGARDFRTVRKRAGKFFFEKKNQKTSPGRCARTKLQRIKVFCFFFPKKKRLLAFLQNASSRTSRSNTR
jgi:hypothetical protein